MELIRICALNIRHESNFNSNANSFERTNYEPDLAKPELFSIDFVETVLNCIPYEHDRACDFAPKDQVSSVQKETWI